MDAAEQLVSDAAEPLTWAEICARYPDQYVCLVDIVHPRLRSPEIITARVVGHSSIGPRDPLMARIDGAEKTLTDAPLPPTKTLASRERDGMQPLTRISCGRC